MNPNSARRFRQLASMRFASCGPLRHALAALLIGVTLPTLAAWEPTAPVELVVPAGTGGGADQMARFIQQVVSKHGLMKQPLTVVNKSGNSGAEGLLDVKAARGNPHKLIITLSNLFTTPIATGTDFNWRDITPVEMLALDQFVLWVNAASPHKSAKELLDAMRAGPHGSFKLGGTGSKQEDQLVSVLLETAGETRLIVHTAQGWRRRRALAGRAPGRHHGQQPDRGRQTVVRRQGAAAVRVRRQAPGLPRQDRRQPDLERPADMHVLRHPGAIPDDARASSWRRA